MRLFKCNRIYLSSPKDAKKFLDKYKRVDLAVDAYYTDPNQFGPSSTSRKSDSERISRLNALFDKYKGTSARQCFVAY
jgi:DCN1-like protein 1/2